LSGYTSLLVLDCLPQRSGPPREIFRRFAVQRARKVFVPDRITVRSRSGLRLRSEIIRHFMRPYGVVKRFVISGKSDFAHHYAARHRFNRFGRTSSQLSGIDGRDVCRNPLEIVNALLHRSDRRRVRFPLLHLEVQFNLADVHVKMRSFHNRTSVNHGFPEKSRMTLMFSGVRRIVCPSSFVNSTVASYPTSTNVSIRIRAEETTSFPVRSGTSSDFSSTRHLYSTVSPGIGFPHSSRPPGFVIRTLCFKGMTAMIPPPLFFSRRRRHTIWNTSGAIYDGPRFIRTETPETVT